MDDYTLNVLDDGSWEVVKPDGTVYTVRLKNVRFVCETLTEKCPSLRYQGYPCKHIRLVMQVTGAGTRSLKEPRPMAEMATLAEQARRRLEGFGLRPTIAGSIRRGVKATAGDIDIVLVTDKLDALDDTGWWRVSGGANSRTYVYRDVQVNVKAASVETYGATLMHYTGSKDFNIWCRARAVVRGWKLNEFGLWDSTGKIIARQTEEAIFDAIGLDYIAPGERER